MGGIDLEIDAYLRRAEQALQVARGNLEEAFWDVLQTGFSLPHTLACHFDRREKSL